MTATNREIVALHRYFIWANRMRIHFDESLNKKGMPNENLIMAEPYMHYWYAGLSVLIEGWRALELHDEVIDSLLESPNVRLLQRYRNGVFHYQRHYFDQRLLGFITEGVNFVEWVRYLNEEFR